MSDETQNQFQKALYRFELPEDRIAQTPLQQRDQSRLLSVRPYPELGVEHLKVHDLVERLSPGTVVVVNNTQVFPARLLGHRKKVLKEGRAEGGGAVEFFLLKSVGPKRWQGLMKAGSKIQVGFEFEVPAPHGMVGARVIAREDSLSGAVFTAEFEKDPVENRLGTVPLPPYIKNAIAQSSGQIEPQKVEEELARYNTTFASQVGSVAAPTAGRHFTPQLIQALKVRGVEWVELTLHVGIGTFKPVAVDDVREHRMHAETGSVSPEAAQKIQAAKDQGRTIFAVGTTSVRTLEGFWNSKTSKLEAGVRDLDLFIYPGSGHRWSVVDEMLTNFHLPESTLLMMICDFYSNREEMIRIYEAAIREQYRFYSYGDAMWLRRPKG